MNAPYRHRSRWKSLQPWALAWLTVLWVALWGDLSVANVVAGLVQQGPGWRISEYVRMDNIGDRDYVGSVIVNEGNGRFYEPSPRRNMSVGIQATLQF